MPNDDNQPFDLFSEARRHAAVMREFYDSYTAMGFTAEQAFDMTKIALACVLTYTR